MKPRVGDVVHFWPSRSAETPKPSQPFAGIVCFVHDDRRVNLAYLNHKGERCAEKDIRLAHHDDAVPESGYCEWPQHVVIAGDSA